MELLQVVGGSGGIHRPHGFGDLCFVSREWRVGAPTGCTTTAGKRECQYEPRRNVTQISISHQNAPHRKLLPIVAETGDPAKAR
jgi:hypothetical protein